MIARNCFSLSKDFTRPKLDPDGAKTPDGGYPDGFSRWTAPTIAT
jgi:peptide/nickel transport system substrate-binding protein